MTIEIPQLDACDVWVLGGGVSGLTTALVLQSCGLGVAILSDAITVQSPDHQEDPRVATGYAMASAYPHNLKIDDLEGISASTQKVFGELQKLPGSGVSVYRMFEVYEQEPGEAPLGNKRMKFETFEGTPEALEKALNPPIRPGAKYLWGWHFETYFADMPIYLQFLWKRFESNGGCIREEHIDLSVNSFAKLQARSKGKPLVNCLGLGALDALSGAAQEDHAPALIVRGRQAIAHHAPMVCDSDGIALAYNYTPSPDVFSRGDGLPEYVHFFPRSDGWILGQTREPGKLNTGGNWVGSEVKGPYMTISNLAIPAPIIDLNDAILKTWMNCSIDRSTLTAREGLRYYRDPDDKGVRLESETVGETSIIHNYGHGGSGITMSWGCALRAAQMVLHALGKSYVPNSKNSNSDELDSLLLSSVATGSIL